MNKRPFVEPPDCVLLLHTMLLVAGAEGQISTAQKGLLEGHFCSLPEFHGEDFRALHQRAAEVLRHYPTREASVQALATLTSRRAREKAYWLAVDLALCNGDLGAGTRRMLAEVQRTLAVDAAVAAKIREVIALKYVHGAADTTA